MKRYMSMRAYARHRRARGLRGQTHPAVSKAILSGRIWAAVRSDGLIDVDQADGLWPTPAGATVVGPKRGPPPPPWMHRAQLLLRTLGDPPAGSVERKLRRAVESAIAAIETVDGP